MQAATQRPNVAMKFTIGDVVDAIGAHASARCDRSTPIEHVVIDSRQVVPGCLFVALRGERHDAHGFVADALRAGAVAAVVSMPVVGADAERLLRVADTLRALGDLAAWARGRWALRVVAVTGSNGKTTTKEMIGAICRAAYPPPQKVLQTEGNLNNLIGLPLTLLRADGDEVVGVLEMGMNRPGEIARMREIARPDVAVVTNVGRAHLEGLGSLAGVAAAKGEVFAGLPNDAVIAVNLEDEWVRRIAEPFPGRRVTFGRGGEVRAEDVVDLGVDGIRFTLVVADERATVRLPFIGRHNLANALAAAAVARALGLGLDATVAGLEQAPAAAMRMQVLRLGNGVTVINDAYNANPTSTEAALEAIQQLRGRSVVVLGEMRELGSEERHAHREIGARAAALGATELVVVGAWAEEMALGAAAEGMPRERIHVCADHVEAAVAVIGRWQAGDVILVKGSRGAAMERVVQLLEDAGSTR